MQGMTGIHFDYASAGFAPTSLTARIVQRQIGTQKEEDFFSRHVAGPEIEKIKRAQAKNRGVE